MKPICVALALLSVGAAHAQGKVVVPKEIKAIYDRQTLDLKKLDLKHFYSYYDPTFIALDPSSKKSDLVAFKKTINELMRGAVRCDMRVTYTGVTATPALVVVSYVALIDIIVPKGKGKSLHFREVGTDTWKKGPKGWKEILNVDKAFDPVKASR